MTHATRPSDNAAVPILGEPLLTPRMLADELGVTTKSLERWRATGEGPPFLRVSRKIIRYRKTDVEGFLAARVATSTTSKTGAR